MRKKDELTHKQYSFVTNYVKNGFNAYQAALSAGYSKQFANSQSAVLLKREGIKERIERAITRIDDKLEKELAITLADKCKVLAKIIYDIVPQDGSEPKRDYYKDALKAISELSNMQGHYAPDKRVSVTVDATQEKLNEAKKVYEDY